MTRVRRGALILLATVALGSVLVWAFRPPAILVETAAVATGRFEAVIEEIGRTRVRDRFVLSAPMRGRVLRIDAKVGDTVSANVTVATILPAIPDMLDPRTRRELEERIGAIEAAIAEATARVDRARTQLAQADNEIRRVRALHERGVASLRQLERDELALRLAERDLRIEELRQHIAEHELGQTRALLQRYESPQPLERWPLTAPTGGRILRVLQESEASVAAGAPLLEIGDTGDLEVIVDLLTTDAVRVGAGAPVTIERWGGEEALQGRVRLVEPAAFTKVSALGVEEQRVWVVIDLTTPRERWLALGDGYRVDVRIVVQTLDNATLVPSSALFRRGGAWFVFLVVDGVAREREVRVVARSGPLATVDGFPAQGDRVVVFPPSSLTDGARIRER